MPYVRPMLATAGLVVALASSLLAQTESASTAGPSVDSTADMLVLDHDFTSAAGEVVRVFLQSKQVYRAELASPDLTLQIRAVGGRIRPPRIYPITGPESASQASVAELYPDVDAEYELRAIGQSGAGVVTRLRLVRDVSASRRRMAVLGKPGWGVGFELATGWHSGFAQSTGSPSATATADPHAGTDVEACFSARSPRGAAICVFGIGYQSQVGAKSILWFYTEPRLRLIGKGAPGRSNWEFGALFRVGVGSIERTSSSPLILAPGGYIARQIRSGDHGGGWSIQGSYSHALYSGFPDPLAGTSVERRNSERLTLGLGWYR
jgi:hypothetical protein